METAWSPTCALAGIDGITLPTRLRERRSSVSVVVLTAFADILLVQSVLLAHSAWHSKCHQVNFEHASCCRASSEQNHRRQHPLCDRCLEEMIMVWNWFPVFEPTPPGPFPTFVDVGAPLANPDPTDATILYVYWVGSDGTLWRCQSNPTEGWEQIPVPAGTVTRIAVAPNGSLWCVTKNPAAAYYLANGNPNGRWETPAGGALAGDQPFDVCVARDSSIWIVMTRGQQWISRTDGHFFNFEMPPLMAVAGFTEPVSDSNAGGAWGIFGDATKAANGGSIAWCNGAWVLTPSGGGSFISNVVDLSTSPNYLWMVKTDGTVWTTQDGISEVRMGETFLALRISGGYVSEKNTGTYLGEVTYAVGKDGLPYVWREE